MNMNQPSRLHTQEMSFSIETNPSGYSAPCFGYVVADDDGNLWIDGGYASDGAATNGAIKRIKELQA